MRTPSILARLAVCILGAGCGAGGALAPVARGPAWFQSTNPPTTGTRGGPPWASAQLDWDGDGDRDLVTANEGTDDVTLFMANGRGGYDVAGPFAAGPGPAGVASGAFDADGRPDLAVTNALAATVSILLQGPGGTVLGPGSFPAVVASPGPVVAGRFDDDPWDDLVVASTTTADARLLRGDGLGGFADGGPVPVSLRAFHVAVGDLDGDGRADLVVRGEGGLEVLRGGPGGAFTSTGVHPVGSGDGRVVLAEMDGVPGLDVLTTDDGDETLSIFPNRSGILGAPSVRPTKAGPVGVATGDVDGDGRLDVAIACEGVHFLMTFSGRGDGSVQPGLLIPVLSGCYDLYLDDLDRDGLLDLTVVLVDPPFALFTMLGR